MVPSLVPGQGLAYIDLDIDGDLFAAQIDLIVVAAVRVFVLMEAGPAPVDVAADAEIAGASAGVESKGGRGEERQGMEREGGICFFLVGGEVGRRGDWRGGLICFFLARKICILLDYGTGTREWEKNK